MPAQTESANTDTELYSNLFTDFILDTIYEPLNKYHNCFDSEDNPPKILIVHYKTHHPKNSMKTFRLE